MKDKKKIILIMACVCLVISILLGITYAWFNYTTEGANQKLVAGDIYLTMGETGNGISLTNIFPETKEEARARNDNYMTFTLSGLNTSDKDIYYEIKLKYGEDKPSPKMRYTDSDLVFDLVEIGSNNEETYIVDAKSYDSINDKRIWVDTIDHNTTTEVVKTYKLRMWLSEDVIISDSDPNASYPATGDNAFKNYYGNVKIEVFGDFTEKDMGYGYNKVLKAIDTNATGTCENIIYEEDGIKYFSGTNDCINFNYVWYSGKLWRITAIYPDGTMKLITQNNITTIAFNESNQVNFWTDENTTSYMYQWLNEDFYDTLYNASEIIDTTKKWNATNSNASDTSEISTRLPETTMVTANVGLLNSYEYYNSYRCVGSSACTGTTYSTGYLRNNYYSWLLNPYSASYVWYLNNAGNGSGTNSDPTYVIGVRPSINLKSRLEFTGNGTVSDPYKIVGDKDIGSVNDHINTRISGEYVKLKNGSNEQLFRIMDIENSKTKIIAMDYADNKGTRKFATSTYDTLWGSGTTTGTDTWYDYLNNTYLPNLKTTYNELFDSGTYYLGTSAYNYKLSVCANTTSGNTKVCDKTSEVGTFNIGLPRYGEIFATQQSDGYANSINMRLMNRYSATGVWYVSSYGFATIESPTRANGGRPTLHLKSTVKILSGSGTQNDPYVVGL